MPTVSECIVKVLGEFGVRQIFGVVGDALNGLNDAVLRDGRMQWVGVRHEEAGAFAAGAQVQINGGIGVCAGTVGPGSIHLLNGLYDAKKSHVPLLAIAGQVPIAEMGTEYFQEVDNDALFRDVSVYRHTIVSPKQMPRAVHLAVQAALAKRGVAVLSVPGDVGEMSIDQSPTAKPIFADDPPTTPTREYLERAAKMIDKAGRVTIFAGEGCRGGRSEILRLAEKLKAPMVISSKAKDFLEYDNPRCAGMTGLIGNPAAAHAIESCELLILAGTDFPYRDWLPNGKTVLQIDVALSHLGRRCPIDLGLVGHVSCTAAALADYIQEKTDDSHCRGAVEEFDEWSKEQQSWAGIERPDGKLAAVVDKVENPSGKVRPEFVAATISELADANAVFTADVGMCTVWAARFLRMKPGQRWLCSFNLGSMANAMPQAIGAQAVDRNRQVISLSGDGGFTMLMGDFLTAIQHELPIKVVLFNNGTLGMVKLEQEIAGIPETGVTLKNPNFAHVAEAMGATGIRVEDPKMLRSALERGLSTPGPVLVDVVTNPNEVSLPPKVEVDQAWGFAIAKVRETVRSWSAK